jgi:hypothetical protein
MATVSPPWTPLLVALATVAAVSVIGQVVGATQGSSEVSVLAAAAFVGAILKVGWQANRPWWTLPADGELARDIGPSPADALPLVSARTTLLLAIGYAWGAVSLFAVYLGTPLKWQHGWQYAAAMALAAIGTHLVTRAIETRWSARLHKTLIWATLLHGWAALGAMTWLIASGKLYSVKSDWAANIVFAAGTLAIAGLASLWLRSSRILHARALEMGANDAPQR